MAFPTYGKLLLNGHQGEPESAILRTDFETGPAKQSKQKSRVAVLRDMAIQFTAAELASFETWFRDAECDYGAGWFDWTDPRNGQTIQARLYQGTYRYQAVSTGEGAPIAWLTTFQLEYMEG